MNRKEEADFYYDVWRSGGNPDEIDFEARRNQSYDWYYDQRMVQQELQRQRPRYEPIEEEQP